MEHQLDESVWRRGWNDAQTAWKSLPFILLDTVVCVVVGGIWGWYWGLGLFVFAMLCVWIVATVHAPVKQRDEARNELKRYEGLLWIRAKGRRCLDDRMGPIRKTLAWYFVVNITNPSSDKNLGIRSIVLRSKRDPKYTLKPIKGIVGAGIQGPKDEGLSGDFGSELFLEPSEPKAGTLLFVGESKTFMNNVVNNWDNGGLFDDGEIVLIDNQGSEYSFPTDTKYITSL